MAPHIRDRSPGEGADRHHDHHRDKAGHRNDRDQRIEHDQQEQQEHAGDQRRKAGFAAGLHVDHGLPDHRAAAHAAQKAGDEIGDALPAHLARLARRRVGEIVDDLRGQHRFEQPDGSHRQRIGRDDPQRFKRHRHMRQRDHRQRRRQLAHIADRIDVNPAIDGDQREHDDRHQRRRYRLGQPRQQIDDRQAARDQCISDPAQREVSCGSCAMKIRIASALTKPVMTERET